MNLQQLDQQYFATMRWETRIPGLIREETEHVVRYTSPHKSQRYILAIRWPLTAPILEIVKSEVAAAREHGVHSLTWRIHSNDGIDGLESALIENGLVLDERGTQHFVEPSILLLALAKFTQIGDLSTREYTRPEELDNYLPIWEEAFPGQEHQRYLDDYKLLIRDNVLGVRFFAAHLGQSAISSGYMFHNPGDPMALLCGGATRTSARGRGGYLALVAVRAKAARDAGVETLCVDASEFSAPILRRLGFVPNHEVLFFETGTRRTSESNDH